MRTRKKNQKQRRRNFQKRLTFIILLITINGVFAQEILVKDLDGDGVMDTVRFEYTVRPLSHIYENRIISDNVHICDTISKDYLRIVCLLSSRQFEKMYSREIWSNFWECCNETDYYITPTCNGFEYHAQYTHYVAKAQFRYEKQTGKIQLIGMSSYDTGRADGDGKGKSSVNLLTKNFIGDWNLLEPNLDKIVKIPTIETKMDFGKIYLESFNDEILSDYYMKSDELRNEQATKIVEVNIEKMKITKQ